MVQNPVGHRRRLCITWHRANKFLQDFSTAISRRKPWYVKTKRRSRNYIVCTLMEASFYISPYEYTSVYIRASHGTKNTSALFFLFLSMFSYTRTRTKRRPFWHRKMDGSAAIFFVQSNKKGISQHAFECAANTCHWRALSAVVTVVWNAIAVIVLKAPGEPAHVRESGPRITVYGCMCSTWSAQTRAQNSRADRAKRRITWSRD